MTPVRIVLCTIDSADAARKLARRLVQDRLAACVNIIENVTSVYKWEGRIEEDAELLLVIKTQDSRLQELMDRISEIHPTTFRRSFRGRCRREARPTSNGSPLKPVRFSGREELEFDAGTRTGPGP